MTPFSCEEESDTKNNNGAHTTDLVFASRHVVVCLLRANIGLQLCVSTVYLKNCTSCVVILLVEGTGDDSLSTNQCFAVSLAPPFRDRTTVLGTPTAGFQKNGTVWHFGTIHNFLQSKRKKNMYCTVLHHTALWKQAISSFSNTAALRSISLLVYFQPNFDLNVDQNPPALAWEPVPRGTHTQAFLYLQHLVHYDDICQHVYFRAGLNEKTRTYLPRDEPLGSFEYVEWELLHHGSPFTICKSKEESRLPASATCPTTAKPVPTTDAEMDSATVKVPASWTEQRIIPEPEPDGSSDQVCEQQHCPCQWIYWWTLRGYHGALPPQINAYRLREYVHLARFCFLHKACSCTKH